jgi:predicted homoserine dehydrogenase-like protein
MIIIDKFLAVREKEGNPIRVGIIGAGNMGKALVHQITRFTPGMEVVVIVNRTLQKAVEAYEYAGHKPVVCNDLKTLQQCISQKKPAVTQDPTLACEADGIDILVECTGTISYAAEVVFKAIQSKKHVLLYNAEVDATLGPILKVYADKVGVMLSGSDGDQPGAIMNLYRYVKNIGLRPLVCGNIKGLQDFYRNPTTQKNFAETWNMRPDLVASFADGSKISFEQACVSNATGIGIAKRGMLGYNFKGHIDETISLYDVEELKNMGGTVDYIVGAQPGPGVYVLATTDDPMTKHYLKYMKMGDGPLYSFYTPFHLIYMEIPFSIARMILLNDIAMAPLGGPVVEVITLSKTQLKKGKKLDGLGGYDTYGQCENAIAARKENLLPIGLAEGMVIKHDLPRDHAISFDDVELYEGNLALKLYKEQLRLFFPHLKGLTPF